ncbi:hypothetical protein [Anaeromyxobacter paludicola]|uniref:Uncharacterized protein n=1 Tax=Anaeromyxobacter paludicola TaxID=2918171 RepID=A0ABN6NCI9_9BACT|nr:hypothetical protein [Anaeromyxobacter paludicola]BDG10053.1 hypothetical protein AMPC_31660 [Anaeromyxobacter paludicola]
MTVDETRAAGAVVEILDALNGDRLVGLGVALPGGAVATSCQCLPRPTGNATLPDPDAPGILVLVRIRRPGTDRRAFAIVTYAEPCSGLALLGSATAAGLTVPDELNPALRVEELLQELAPALPEPSPSWEGPVRLGAPGGAFGAGELRGATLFAPGLAELLPGAPVLGESGRAIGIVSHGGASAALCRFSEHLPAASLLVATPS